MVGGSTADDERIREEHTAIVMVDDAAELGRYERWLSSAFDVAIDTGTAASDDRLSGADVVLRTRPFPRVDRWSIDASFATHDAGCLVLIATEFVYANRLARGAAPLSATFTVEASGRVRAGTKAGSEAA